MHPFYWNRNFEIGILAVDQQHRMLLDLINDLAQAVSGGAHLPEVNRLTDSLMTYAVQHFAEEEQLLARAPMSREDKVAHRGAHRAFVEKVQQLVQREDLLEPEIIQGVLEFLTTWLVSHILGVDRKLALALHLIPESGEQRPSLVDVSPVERILLGALTETEGRFRLLSDHTPSLIWVSDALGQRGFFNRAWCELLGKDLDAVHQTWADHLHPEDKVPYGNFQASLITDPRPDQMEFRLRDRDGHDRWFFEKTLPRRSANGTFMGLIASAIDVTSLKDAERLLTRANGELEQEVSRRTAQLELLMMTDPLTGVGNRRQLMARLETETDRARRYQRDLSVLFIDLDHFKRVNDTLGHPVGDQVLVAVAGHLMAQVRGADSIGRIGGEEFVILLPDTQLEPARVAAERWLSAVATLSIPGLTWPMTASAGVAQYQDGDTAETLLARCDRALYRAKADGRACVRVG